MFNEKKHFKLHVAMVQAQEDCTSAAAQFMAWQEGPRGLARRLGQLELFDEKQERSEELKEELKDEKKPAKK